MASGLPVLASAHAGLPEMIREGESGFLVPEADPEALAAGIGRALDASGRWPEIGAAARRTVELEFNAEVQARRLEALYAELLAR
jgi:glycosyltransferase involved in cell wall biosynthesis